MSYGGRRLGVALLCAAALGAGCGGDDEDRPQSRDTATQPAPDTATTESEAKGEPAPGKDGDGGGSGGAQAPPAGEAPPGGASPEDQPGGAGDEIPARSQALITGRGGRLSPRRVFVPPFISVRVELRSADGAQYTLAGGGKTLTVGGEVARTTADFDGLRPGGRLVLSGPAGRVTVEASAEPGP